MRGPKNLSVQQAATVVGSAAGRHDTGFSPSCVLYPSRAVRRNIAKCHRRVSVPSDHPWKQNREPIQPFPGDFKHAISVLAKQCHERDSNLPLYPWRYVIRKNGKSAFLLWSGPAVILSMVPRSLPWGFLTSLPISSLAPDRFSTLDAPAWDLERLSCAPP